MLGSAVCKSVKIKLWTRAKPKAYLYWGTWLNVVSIWPSYALRVVLWVDRIPATRCWPSGDTIYIYNWFRFRFRRRLFDRFTWNTFANIMTHTYTSWYIVSLYRHRKSKVFNPTAPQPPVAPWVVIMTTQVPPTAAKSPNRPSTVINGYGRIGSHRSPKLCYILSWFCERTCTVYPRDNLGTGRQRIATMPPCRHPRHRRLSFWQPAMPPATTRSAPWQLSALSGRTSCGDIC